MREGPIRDADVAAPFSIEAITRLEERLGVVFRRKALLVQALTHRSAVSSQSLKSNERLEFLGDAVLGMIVVEWLYKHYPLLSEGALAKAKAYAVSEKALAEVAKSLGLEEFLVLSSAERMAGGRGHSSIQADAFEALVGALYLDRGLRITKRFVLQHLRKVVEEAVWESPRRDYKSALQELTQAHFRLTPVYCIRAEYGSEHDKTFEAEVLLHEQPLGRGVGKSKKEAEQAAARAALENWSESLTSEQKT